MSSENKEKYQVYKFLEKVREGGTRNELTGTDGVTNLTLVLDGQQRLTSLMIGLKGTYVRKKKYKRWDNPDAWSTQRLHLDLLAEPRLEDDGETGLYYKFEFMEDTPPPDAEHYWFRVGGILEFDEMRKFETFCDKKDDELEKQDVTRTERKIVEKNLARLYHAIHTDDSIAYHLETDQDDNRVLDIFVRANDGGVTLTKSDLLLSMVTANWEGVNAREEIFNFVDWINDKRTRKNNFDKDFIMKSCLVLTDQSVKYKVENFNDKTLHLIREQWSHIKKAIERGVDLANSFGIDRDNLTSVNALIPVIYYLFKNPGVTLQGSTPFEARNADSIRNWLIMALLKGAFGRASDTLIAGIRENIKSLANPGADFPVEKINVTIGKTGLTTAFDDQAVNDVLDLTYGGQRTFLALSLLYDDAAWGTMQFHQDHIFARSQFKSKELSALGRGDWMDKREHFGNLCLLLATENFGKQDMPVDKWLSSRGSGFLKRHLLPDDKSLWTLDRFADFVDAREELIRGRLKALFAPVSTLTKSTDSQRGDP